MSDSTDSKTCRSLEEAWAAWESRQPCASVNQEWCLHKEASQSLGTRFLGKALVKGQGDPWGSLRGPAGAARGMRHDCPGGHCGLLGWSGGRHREPEAEREWEARCGPMACACHPSRHSPAMWPQASAYPPWDSFAHLKNRVGDNHRTPIVCMRIKCLED